MVDLLRSASVVVAAEVVRDGTTGEVAIRPTATLVGSLPLDADGLYRFESEPLTDVWPGLWAFDSEGAPMWSDEATELNAPPFPWRIPGEEYFVFQAYPEVVQAEAARVLSEADLIVGLRSEEQVRETPVGEETLVLVQVVRGDPGVAVGGKLRVKYFVDYQQQLWVELRDESIWALQNIDGEWVTVPTWLSPAWDCNQAGLFELVDEFPDVRLERNPPSQCSYRELDPTR